jgi:hypothetical protein
MHHTDYEKFFAVTKENNQLQWMPLITAADPSAIRHQ